MPQLWAGCHSKRMSGRGNAVPCRKWAPGLARPIAQCTRPWQGKGAGGGSLQSSRSAHASCLWEPRLCPLGAPLEEPVSLPLLHPGVSLSCTCSLGVGGEQAQEEDWALGQLVGDCGPAAPGLGGEVLWRVQEGAGSCQTGTLVISTHPGLIPNFPECCFEQRAPQGCHSQMRKRLGWSCWSTGGS